MKTLISTLILGAGLVLSGCGNNQKTEEKVNSDSLEIIGKSEKKLTELEKYNLENKKIYEDFLKFCLENPTKREYAKKQYHINLPNNNHINFTEGGFIRLSINGKSFLDGDGKGLDDKLADGQTFKDKNTNLIETERIENMPPEKQLSVAEEYMNALIEIMREGGHPDYKK